MDTAGSPTDEEPAGEGLHAVESVRRALQILDIVAERGSAGATDVAADLGIHKSTASRLMSTLVGEGLLDRDPRTRRVRLGLGILRLSGSLGAWVDLVNMARPTMRALSERFGVSVTIATLSGGQAVNIEQTNDPRSTAVVQWRGRATPLYCTSAGKVLLAFASPAMRGRLLSRPMPAITPATITDRGVLEKQLEEVRRRGVAVGLGEHTEGEYGVSAPVRRGTGAVVAALCAYGPPSSLGPHKIPLVEAGTMEAAEVVSARLGDGARSF